MIYIIYQNRVAGKVYTSRFRFGEEGGMHGLGSAKEVLRFLEGALGFP